jgi:hypothetical protein
VSEMVVDSSLTLSHLTIRSASGIIPSRVEIDRDEREHE